MFGRRRCCCNTSIPCSVCNTGTTPSQMQVVLSSLGDNPSYFFAPCGNCSNLNGTYTLDQTFACEWKYTFSSGDCNATALFLTLASLGGGFMRLAVSLQFSTGAGLRSTYWWETFADPYDCSTFSSTAINDTIAVEDNNVPCTPVGGSISTSCLVTSL